MKQLNQEETTMIIQKIKRIGSMKKKIIVDILMFILMLLEFSRGYLPTILHEIFGICLSILVIIHLILNRNYFKNLFKVKYNIKMIIMLIINLGFFITFILSMIFGILSSQDLLTSLNIDNLNIVKLHKQLAYLSLIFMGLHLGINFNAMLGKINIKNKIVKYIIEILIILFGIYSFINIDFIKHITGEFGFSVYDGNIFLNIIKYLSMILTMAIIANKKYSLRKKENKNER